MKKVEAIFQGFVLLGLLFIAMATFLFVCLLGYCDQKWVVFNVFFSLFSEVFIFIRLVILLKKGLDELKNMMKPRVVVKLCDDMRTCTFIAIGYSVVQLFFPGVDFHMSIIYGANIFLVASFFFVWMTIKINDIEKWGRFWLWDIIKEKGYWNRNNLFFENLIFKIILLHRIWNMVLGRIHP